MKRFTFNLDALLVLREWEQRKARQRLVDASAQLNEIEQEIASLGEDRESVYQQWDAQAQGAFSARSRVELGLQVAQLQRVAQEAEAALRSAAERREQAVLALNAATRDLKVVENLREKRLQEHRAEALRAETAEIEDVFNARRKALYES